MLADLNEKLEYEREILFLDNLRKSKEAIYTAAEEISCKKKIQAALRCMVENLSPCQQEKLYNLDSITEAAYRFIYDYRLKENEMEVSIKRWIDRM